MPIYEYRCEKCGVFEETQRITDPALERCPTCRRKVRRLISSTSFQLKGGGWYVTDYGRAGQSGKKTGEKSGESSSGNSDGGSSTSSTGSGESKTSSDNKTSSDS
ncbi:MAG TPA: zinc ribbon domain-containing protein, partial [Myxococcaceae bacterium]